MAGCQGRRAGQAEQACDRAFGRVSQHSQCLPRAHIPYMHAAGIAACSQPAKPSISIFDDHLGVHRAAARPEAPEAMWRVLARRESWTLMADQ